MVQRARPGGSGGPEAGCRKRETGRFGSLSNPSTALPEHQNLKGLLEERDEFDCFMIVRILL
jgi:hypothetical protein